MLLVERQLRPTASSLVTSIIAADQEGEISWCKRLYDEELYDEFLRVGKPLGILVWDGNPQAIFGIFGNSLPRND